MEGKMRTKIAKNETGDHFLAGSTSKRGSKANATLENLMAQSDSGIDFSLPSESKHYTKEMAKNMQNTGFRKLDVDAYNEDQYRAEEEDMELPALGPDENEVVSLLQQNRLPEAVKAALKNPPLKTRNQAVKDRATQLMTRVLTSFKQPADMEKVVQSLEREELDLLMKYIYKGFEFPQDGSSATLLVWHDKVFSIAGLGCIVRTFTDLKRL